MIGAKRVAADTTCHDIDTHELCELAAGCKWQDAHHHCLGEHENDVPCTGEYDEHSCKERKNECQWFPEAGKCKPKGTVLTCDDITIPLGCTVRDDCEWSTDNLACHRKGKHNLPYEQLKSEYSCSQRNTCMWLTGTRTFALSRVSFAVCIVGRESRCEFVHALCLPLPLCATV